MRLSAHFTRAELERSQTAARLRIDNRIPPELMPNARLLVAMLERIRAYLGGHPVHVTSGYRCPELNQAIGGARDSHHTLALAADIVVPGAGSPHAIARRLAPVVDALRISQLIAEYAGAEGGGWVHVGCMNVLPMNRILTVDARGTHIGIHSSLEIT